jgi:hypothetical protein
VRADDFFADATPMDSTFAIGFGSGRSLNHALLAAILAGRDAEHPDVEVAPALARLAHDDLCASAPEEEKS